MRSAEFVGYLACTLVFATFCVKAMMALRLIAIASNIAFMSYGFLGEIVPILLLHAGLLPLNAWRLCETLRSVSGPQHAMRRAGLSVKLLRQRKVRRRRTAETGRGRSHGQWAPAKGINAT